MPSQLWAALLLCLVSSPWVITSGLPNIPNPNGKAAFSQILQANMEIERDCKYSFIELRSLQIKITSLYLDRRAFSVLAIPSDHTADSA